MTILDELKHLLEQGGGDLYGREAITQKQHALQCGLLAEQEGAPASLITAAFLHDIGHLIDEEFESALDDGVDRRHEDLGWAYLSKWFGEDVTEPVRMHVDAKRYLCASDPLYHATLSAASKHTLDLQGGPFTEAEAREFIERPHAREAVRLRHWDDLGKDPEMVTPDVDHFLEIASTQLRPQGQE